MCILKRFLQINKALKSFYGLVPLLSYFKISNKKKKSTKKSRKKSKKKSKKDLSDDAWSTSILNEIIWSFYPLRIRKSMQSSPFSLHYLAKLFYIMHKETTNIEEVKTIDSKWLQEQLELTLFGKEFLIQNYQPHILQFFFYYCKNWIIQYFKLQKLDHPIL